MAEYKSNYTGEEIDAAIGKANTALQEELEPAFNASASKNITSQDITNWNAKAELSDIPDVSNFITKDVNNLTNYELKTNTGATIELTINSSTYEMTLNLKNSAGTTISTDNVDLPLETMVVGATYNNNNKKIILELKNGTTLDVPVGDLINGLQSEITSSNKLDASLVDDSLSTNKFTDSTEKTAWNSKYDKPSTGIPETDLAQEVQNILNDVSNKEDTSNKVSTIDAQSTNTQYAGAKAVWDLISSLGGFSGGQFYGSQYIPFIFENNKVGLYSFADSNPLTAFYYKRVSGDTAKAVYNACPIMLNYHKDISEITSVTGQEYFATLLYYSNPNNNEENSGTLNLAHFYLTMNTSDVLVINYSEGLTGGKVITGKPQKFYGVKKYQSYPEIASYTAPTTNTQLVPKKYVDDTIASAITTTLGGNY